MPEQIIKTTHAITVTTEIPYPEAFPGMNLTEAVSFQKNMDLESVIECIMVATGTKLESLVSVHPAPEEEDTTRPGHTDG